MNRRKEWWENFFTREFIDLWEAAVTEQQTSAEADFIVRALGVKPPAKLLDVPCGSGRLALPLSSRGYQVTGVDFSRECIERTRARAQERQLNVALERRDMRDLPWKRKFQGAFCFGNSFGYFEPACAGRDDGHRAFLESLVNALKPGARFVLDTTSAEAIFPTFQERSRMEVGKFVFLEENRYAPLEGRIYTKYTIVRDGKATTQVGSQRIFALSEIRQLLEGVGFEEVEAYSSLNREAYGIRSPRLFIICRRRRR